MTSQDGCPEGAKRTARRLSRTMLRTVVEHRLVEAGDRILVAVSGGKDSLTLADLLCRARRRAPFPFDLLAFHLDQGQPGHDTARLREWLETLGLPHEIHREDTYSSVLSGAEALGERAHCRLCSRLRRGILYTAAERLGCNKIALGHHRDDAIETLLLNLLYAGRLQAMPAGYVTNDGRFRVVRPLIECAESEIAAHAAAAAYPPLPGGRCVSGGSPKRQRVERLIAEMEAEIPDVRSVMLAAIKNVRPTHLLDRAVSQAWEREAFRHPSRR